MAEKDDIDKIDEQIRSLTEGPEEEKEVEEEDSDTKAVDKIEDLETTVEEDSDTKPLDKIEDLETTVEEESVEEEETQEEEKEVEEEDSSEEQPEKVEEKKEDPPVTGDAPKKKKTLLIVAIVVGCFVLVLLIILGIVLLTKKPDKKVSVDTKNHLTETEKKEIIDDYGEALQGIISVYYEQQDLLLKYEDAILLVKFDYDVVCDEHEIYDNGLIYLNKCSIDDKEVKYSFGKKQEKEELKEGAIKVYVNKTSKKATLKEPKEIKDYETYSFDIDGKYSELRLMGDKSDYITYLGEDYNNYIMNYKTRKKALEDLDYSSITPIAVDGVIDQKYVAVCIHDKWGIYNLKNGEKVVSNNYVAIPPLTLGSYGPRSQFEALEDGIIAVIKYERDTSSYGVINYHSGNFMIPCEYRSLRTVGNYLLAIDVYGVAHIFDYHGKEQLVDAYDEVYGAVDEKFILVKDGKEAKLVNIQGKEIYNYGELTLGRYNYSMSYKNGAAFMFDNPKANHEALDESCIEVIYDPSTKSGETKKTYCGGIAKPILYLYPEKNTDIIVRFQHPELLETTYPKYTDRWTVTAKKNGDLTDKNGKYYYGLYWDEKQVHSVDFSTGYYVTKEKAIDFLEEKLEYIGLSDRERNEFITYWLPILEKNEQSLVYFELTEERESVNKIYITPKPDSLLRLVIHIKKVDHKVEIPKESLTRFHRKGFVAVEWGGVTY